LSRKHSISFSRQNTKLPFLTAANAHWSFNVSKAIIKAGRAIPFLDSTIARYVRPFSIFIRRILS
jgi:hypothetical protein